MCGIKDCPEVDLSFQGTGMNGWLVSAVYDTMKVLIELPTKKNSCINRVSQLTKVLGRLSYNQSSMEDDLSCRVLCTLQYSSSIANFPFFFFFWLAGLWPNLIT